jgi:hypothetical protein
MEMEWMLQRPAVILETGESLRHDPNFLIMKKIEERKYHPSIHPSIQRKFGEKNRWD